MEENLFLMLLRRWESIKEQFRVLHSKDFGLKSPSTYPFLRDILTSNTVIIKFNFLFNFVGCTCKLNASKDTSRYQVSFLGILGIPKIGSQNPKMEPHTVECPCYWTHWFANRSLHLGDALTSLALVQTSKTASCGS